MHFDELFQICIDPQRPCGFSNLDTLVLEKVSISDSASSSQCLAQYLQTTQVSELQFRDCSISKGCIKAELASAFFMNLTVKKLTIDLGYSPLFVSPIPSKGSFVSTELLKLTVRANFESEADLLGLMRQVTRDHQLYSLDIHYLGTESLNNLILTNLQEILTGPNLERLKLFTLTIGREFLK